MNDLIYSGEFVIEGDSGEVIEYKYAILKADGNAFYETRANPDNLPYGNRKFTIGDEPGDSQPGKYITNTYRLGSIGMEFEFPADELHEDFRKVRQTLEENHCCL